MSAALSLSRTLAARSMSSKLSPPSMAALSMDTITVLPAAIPVHTVQHSREYVRVSLGGYEPSQSLLSYLFGAPTTDGGESSIKP